MGVWRKEKIYSDGQSLGTSIYPNLPISHVEPLA